jgi:hypothetical protein
VDGDVPERVHGALMELAGVGNVERESLQLGTFHGEQLSVRSSKRAAELGVDLIAPDDELSIQIGNIGEGASDVEIVLDVVEGALDAR